LTTIDLGYIIILYFLLRKQYEAIFYITIWVFLTKLYHMVEAI